MTEPLIMLSDARSGCTFFSTLLRRHSKVNTLLVEPLENREQPIDNPIEILKEQMQGEAGPVIGYKISPEQMRLNKLTGRDVVRHCGVKHVIVVWRESCLETFVSFQIAAETGVWCSTDAPKKVERVRVEEAEFIEYRRRLERDWRELLRDWPIEIDPIFVKFDDLINCTMKEMHRVLLRLSLDPDGIYFKKNKVQRQNPSSLSNKVINFDELPTEIQKSSLDVPFLFREAIEKVLNVPPNSLSVVPNSEPPAPPNGWRYKISEAYIPNNAKQNVIEALDSNDILSGGCWPKQLALKLRNFFGVPVAQPCSSGFGALVLALQAANIGANDEVIIPSLTMVAVANAIMFMSAKPVPVDNASNEYNPGVVELLAAATDKTKAVIVTHTYGFPSADTESLSRICTVRGWFLIEDISDCAGVSIPTMSGKQKLLGTFGDFACSSLFNSQMLQGGDGGFVLARDRQHASRLESLVNNGLVDTLRYVHLEKAANFNICGLAAAVACASFDSVENVLERRHKLAEIYRSHLASVPVKIMPTCGPRDTPSKFCLICSSKMERQKLREYLACRGIETRNFFFPIHLQPMFLTSSSNDSKCFPNSEYLATNGMLLPSGAALTEKDITEISCCVVQFFSESVKVNGEIDDNDKNDEDDASEDDSV